MPITYAPEELDAATYAKNVRAFMVATYRFSGLADATYEQLLSQAAQPSLIQALYPYDAVQVITQWRQHAHHWFIRRNTWDCIVHARVLREFPAAVIDLQRYMPSAWLSDVVSSPLDSPILPTLMAVSDKINALFFTHRGYELMNPYQLELLIDMFNAVVFVNNGGDLGSITSRQVRKNSKATTNDGFELALNRFFKVLSKVIDMPQVRR